MSKFNISKRNGSRVRILYNARPPAYAWMLSCRERGQMLGAIPSFRSIACCWVRSAWLHYTSFPFLGCHHSQPSESSPDCWSSTGNWPLKLCRWAKATRNRAHHPGMPSFRQLAAQTHKPGDVQCKGLQGPILRVLDICWGS